MGRRVLSCGGGTRRAWPNGRRRRPHEGGPSEAWPGAEARSLAPGSGRGSYAAASGVQKSCHSRIRPPADGNARTARPAAPARPHRPNRAAGILMEAACGFVTRVNLKTTERDVESPTLVSASIYGICQREYCNEEGSSRGDLRQGVPPDARAALGGQRLRRHPRLRPRRQPRQEGGRRRDHDLRLRPSEPAALAAGRHGPDDVHLRRQRQPGRAAGAVGAHHLRLGLRESPVTAGAAHRRSQHLPVRPGRLTACPPRRPPAP